MILIIEGMDRCGKSTLVEQLRKNYMNSHRTIVHHSSSPPKVKDPNDWEIMHYKDLFTTAFNLSDQECYDIIFDRFHLGAIVYGKKYRNADPEKIYQIERSLIGNDDNIALILLTDDPSAVMDRDDDGSLESTARDFEETKNSFEDAFERSIIPNKLHINISENGGFKNTYPRVIEFLESLAGTK